MIKRLLILGGGSDIAAAFVANLAADDLQHVVLAGRSGGSRDQAASTLSAAYVQLEVETADFDGADSASHSSVLRQINDAHGPFDCVVVAFGQLGAEFSIDADPAAMLDAYDRDLSAHYKATGKPTTDASWSDEIAKKFSPQPRATLRSSLKERGFDFS